MHCVIGNFIFSVYARLVVGRKRKQHDINRKKKRIDIQTSDDEKKTLQSFAEFLIRYPFLNDDERV
jgi:CRISPR/Cas system-associated protein endoribonuclease Cas2